MKNRTKILAFALGFALGAFLLRPALAQLGSSALFSRDQWVIAANEVPLIPAYPNAALAAALAVGGYKGHPDVAYQLKAASFRVSVGSTGGGTNSIVTVTDGTNTCTFTLPCTTSATAGVYRVAAANGAGTGCLYGYGAGITASVTTAGCTTTQPTVNSLVVVGRLDESPGNRGL